MLSSAAPPDRRGSAVVPARRDRAGGDAPDEPQEASEAKAPQAEAPAEDVVLERKKVTGLPGEMHDRWCALCIGGDEPVARHLRQLIEDPPSPE